ncbi:MAG: outer membrane lipoprotein-sorting protein [Syntrophobacterales bacterium]|nr:outer membrane lipoprotein-sorting protein [Syntrophobacterales bacterium]
MIKKAVVWTVGILFLFSAAAVSAQMTGRQVMEKQKERHKVKTEIGNEDMMLVDKSGAKENRQVVRYAKEVGKDLHRYLVVFLSPGDIRGTALRTWEKKGGDNDQWLYLPAQKKEQRIAKAGKKNYFMGTDFTYEDMEPEDLDNFNYNILRSEQFNHEGKARDCYVIEAIPANEKKKNESGYAKRIMWIEKSNLTTLKTDFFDKRNRHQKTQFNYKFETVSGAVMRPKQTLMNNLEKSHKTVTTTRSRQVNTSLSDATFTEQFIISGKHLQ